VRQLLSAGPGTKSFQSHLGEVCLLNSCSLGRIGPSDGTLLLEVGTNTGANHCNIPCGTASGIPKQQRQAIRVLAVVTNQTVRFLHAGNACASQRAPDNVTDAVAMRYSAETSPAGKRVRA